MTKTTKTEFLSALLDDEAGRFEQRRILDQLREDDALLRKVANYSLIGEALRNQRTSVAVPANFLAGIQDQLHAEPVYQDIHIKEPMRNVNSSSWYKPVAGMAIAASVAALSVILLQKPQEAGGVDNVMASSSSAVVAPVAVIAAVDSVDSDASVNVVTDAAWRDRLVRYVNDHAKYASKSAIMPSVRAVSYAANY